MARVITAEEFAAHQARFGRPRREMACYAEVNANDQRGDSAHRETAAVAGMATERKSPLPDTLASYELPWPPSANNLYRPGEAQKRGHVFLTAGQLCYRNAAIGALTMARARPLLGRLAVEIDLYPPDLRARDIDNRVKAVLDALQHGRAIVNDSQIDKITITRFAPVAGGNCVVRITVIQFPEAA